MTPEDVEELFQSAKSQNEDKDDISEQEEQDRISQLKEVVVYARSAWSSGSDEVDRIAEKLGSGARDASWRVPIGESGLLDFFLSLLPRDGLRQPLKIHTLRVIGNSCADTDENRARVVESKQMKSLVKLFDDDSLVPYLIPVIYNVCVDYEPAQLEASKAGLSPVLMALISGPRLAKCHPPLDIVSKILAMLVTQEPEVEIADPATAAVLLRLATNRTTPPDLEEYCGLASVALAYLTHEKFQSHLLNSNGECDLLLQTFEDSHTHFDVADADQEEVDSLKQISTSFLTIFADISAHESFPALYPINSQVTKHLVGWLSSSDPDLRTAACLSLGNLARSDATATAMLNHVYAPVFDILTASTTSSPTSTTPAPSGQLLHALLSFLKNLAIPPANKPTLGTLLLLPSSSSPTSTAILPALWSSTDTQPQTQFAAVSLARLLATNCPANVALLCAPSPAGPRTTTTLHALAALAARADAEPTKLEAARTFAAVCRALHSPDHRPDEILAAWSTGHGDGDASATTNTTVTTTTTTTTTTPRERFYAAHEPEISTALGRLMANAKFPALRSEALFVMALMARAREGAAVVCRVLGVEEVAEKLAEVVAGKGKGKKAGDGDGDGDDDGEAKAVEAGAAVVTTGGAAGMDAIQGLGLEPRQADPAQAAGMARVDRENGLVLVAEILRQDDEGLLPAGRRAALEDVLRAGGEMVVSEREKKEECTV